MASWSSRSTDNCSAPHYEQINVAIDVESWGFGFQQKYAAYATMLRLFTFRPTRALLRRVCALQ
jgi:hypothetical protein